MSGDGTEICVAQDDLRRLRDENEALRGEVQAGREAADITARLVVEQFEETERVLQLVRAANIQREAVLNAASRIAIIAAGRDGTITLFNAGAERLLGCAAEAVVGKLAPSAFLLPEEIEARRAELGLTAVPGDPSADLFMAYAVRLMAVEREWTLVRKDGHRLPATMSVTGIRDNEGGFTGFLCAAMDISQLKEQEKGLIQARQDAEAANRTKSTFLANMSHELRTPLNAIIGYSDMLEEEAEDMKLEGFVSDLKKIQSAGRHLLSLINDVLSLSKIEAGKVDLLIESFDVEAMLRDVAATIAPLAEKGGNCLDLSLDVPLGAMEADLTRTRQILLNLLSNACKFTEKGSVGLSVRRAVAADGERIVFRISDSGIGMNAEQLGRIFQPFTQADATTTKRFGGTGLGLVISRTFARMMGGDIAVQSEEGKGSVFTVTLPVKVTPTAAAAAAPEQSLPGGPGEEPRVAGADVILAIDDDPVVHELLQAYLRKDGYEVVSAMSGPEGLSLARRIHPSMITLDILMPGMDGWAVLRELKTDPVLAPIPVIVITIDENVNLGFTLGASDFLVKPVSKVQLFETLRKYRRPEQPGHVLVVEDEKATRDLLVRTISREGWSVSEAENGRAALERIEDRAPDLIFLDLMMPVMDGFEFVQEFRKRKEHLHVPIVVVTAKELTAAERQWLNGNVFAVFQKGSYRREELLDKIRELVRMNMPARGGEAAAGGRRRDSSGREGLEP
jgi:PAS domain S-box-containing protein